MQSSAPKEKNRIVRGLNTLFFTRVGNRVLLLLLLSITIGVVSYVAVYGADFGPCYIRKTTGLNCISCGATRSTLAMFRQDFGTAFYYNPFLFLLYGALIAWFGFIAFNAFRKPERYRHPLQIPPVVLFVFLSVAVAFAVLRNLPFFRFYFY